MTEPQTALPVVSPTTASPRVRVKPRVSSTAYIDGGWWPRTAQLVTELPTLLSSLAGTIDHIAVVGYHLNAWENTPEDLDFAGQRILLQGFTADDPHSVVIIAHSGQRMTLLVVPPDTAEDAADSALTQACEPTGNGDSASSDGVTDRSLDETITRISTLERAPSTADRDRITRLVNEAALQFAGARVQSFIPILIEHIVRNRLAGVSSDTQVVPATQ